MDERQQGASKPDSGAHRARGSWWPFGRKEETPPLDEPWVLPLDDEHPGVSLEEGLPIGETPKPATAAPSPAPSPAPRADAPQPAAGHAAARSAAAPATSQAMPPVQDAQRQPQTPPEQPPAAPKKRGLGGLFGRKKPAPGPEAIPPPGLTVPEAAPSAPAPEPVVRPPAPAQEPPVAVPVAPAAVHAAAPSATGPAAVPVAPEPGAPVTASGWAAGAASTGQPAPVAASVPPAPAAPPGSAAVAAGAIGAAAAAGYGAGAASTPPTPPPAPAAQATPASPATGAAPPAQGAPAAPPGAAAASAAATTPPAQGATAPPSAADMERFRQDVTQVIGPPVAGAAVIEAPPAPHPAEAFVEAGPEARTFAGKYRAVERIDRGGTIDTYRTVDESGALYSVDVLHPANETEVQHLRDSMLAVAALHHPNLPRVYEWGVDDTGFFVVREYVEGWDLETLLTRGPLDSLRVARYGAEAALGLAAAHSAGIVHGSIRTSEIMVTPEGAVKVLGLGETLPKTLSASGTPAAAYYLAPEQVTGQAPNDCTDLYALAVVLFEAATGTVPFEGPDAGTVAAMQVETEPENLRRVNPTVPPSLDVVVCHALRKQPRERYRSIDEFRQDLDRVADQIQTGTTSDVAAAEGRGKTPRWVVAVVIIALLTLLGGAAAGGWIWWRNTMSSVPTVVGTTPDEARAKLAQAGLNVGNVSYSEDVRVGIPEGSIVSQDPAASTWVRRGTSVDLVINGPERVKVPLVVGKTQTEALSTLQVAGLTIGAITQSFDTSVPLGSIISQTPAAGSEATKGAPVSFNVSKGPQVSTVPNVAGQTQAAATTALEKAGFKVTVSQQFSATVASGLVIGQTPAGGSPGKVGETVALTVSQGTQAITVPNVTGLAQATAVDTIQNLSLRVKVQTSTVTTASGDYGKVVDQSPASGTSAKAGDTVTITVGQL